jgi:gas vesicle structural protein
MAIERAASGSSLIDVLDRVLDKGIVIDAWVRVSLVGIDLLTVEARIVVASIATYLQYSDAVIQLTTVARPGVSTAPVTAVATRVRRTRPRALQGEALSSRLNGTAATH